MKVVAVCLSFLYMIALALFLSFAAIFVCDGYYPVGWGWKGLAIHIAFWGMPLCVVIGAAATALAVRPRIAITLLLLGTGPAIGVGLWMALGPKPSVSIQSHSHWPLIAIAIAILADVVLLLRAAQGMSRHSPSIAIP